jgi:carboxymethylenebutenolidase
MTEDAMRATLAALTLLAAPGLTALAQDPVKERLEKSPRHHEWVEVKQGKRTVHCFVVFPEVKAKALAVIVIHENKGLQNFERGVADRLAEAGYIAIAPDLLSGMVEGGGKTSDLKSTDAATKVLYKLPQEQVTADLNAVADYAKKLDASNGKVAACGFCWGGGQVLRFATNRKDLQAAFVFYGAYPHTDEEIARIACPVYGFYGGNDARINAGVPKTAAAMKEAGKTFEPVTYEGAGHGFMRAGELPGASEANRQGREQAWERWKGILKKIS